MGKALRSLILSTATLLGPHLQGAQTDAELRQNIIGTWYAEATWVKGTQTFYTNWTSVCRQQILATNSTTRVTAYLEETWRIENGVLICTVTKTSDPKITPLGKASTARIVRIDSQEAVLINTDGVTNRVQRRNEAVTPLKPGDAIPY